MKITKIAFIFILILAVNSSCLAVGPGEEKETETLFMAKKAYEDGFYEVSLGMLERFANNFPHSLRQAEARLLTAQCYFFQGRYMEVLNILEGLLNDPAAGNFKDAIYFWIAEVHFKGNNYDSAATFYGKIISDFPQSSYAAQAYYSHGWALFLRGKYALALESFQRLEDKFPKEPQSKDAAFKIIECLYNLKEYSALISRIKPYFKLYANDPLRLPYLYFYLAESNYYLNDFKEAAGNYLRSSQLTTDEKVKGLAKLGLAWSYLKLKRYKDAEEAFAEIKQSNLDKKSIDILLLGQAVLMFQANRVYESKDIYDRLISVSSDPLVLAQACLGKADALYNLAEYAQAAKVYKDGLEKNGKASGSEELIDKLRYNLSLAYIKQGELKLAIEELKNLAGSSPDQEVKVGALSQVGDIYQDSGDFANAEETYKNILIDYPGLPNSDYVQYQLGLAQLRKADLAAAIASFKLMAKNYEQSKLLDDAAYSLGLAYLQKEDYLAAANIFAKFQNEFKDSPLGAQALYMLGTCFINLAKPSEALSVFKDITKLNPQDTELLQKAEYGIADCYYRLGLEKEALGRFKLLRAKYPGSKLTPEIIWWLGQYYYHHDDPTMAGRYFSSLARDFPDSDLAGNAFYALGLTFSDESKLEQAADNFRLAIKHGNAQIRTQAVVALAKVCYKVQDYEGAKLFYSKSLEAADAKEIPEIRFSLAEVLETKAEFDPAIQQYLAVADSYPEAGQLSVRALLRAAKLYEDKENFKEALKIYRRIIEKGSAEAGFAQERIDWIKGFAR